MFVGLGVEDGWKLVCLVRGLVVVLVGFSRGRAGGFGWRAVGWVPPARLPGREAVRVWRLALTLLVTAAGPATDAYECGGRGGTEPDQGGGELQADGDLR